MNASDSFVKEVEDFIVWARMSATAFGKNAIGDPSFVADLRAGRLPSLRMVDRVNAYIEAERKRIRAQRKADAKC